MPHHTFDGFQGTHPDQAETLANRIESLDVTNVGAVSDILLEVCGTPREIRRLVRDTYGDQVANAIEETSSPLAFSFAATQVLQRRGSLDSRLIDALKAFKPSSDIEDVRLTQEQKEELRNRIQRLDLKKMGDTSDLLLEACGGTIEGIQRFITEAYSREVANGLSGSQSPAAFSVDAFSLLQRRGLLNVLKEKLTKFVDRS